MGLERSLALYAKPTATQVARVIDAIHGSGCDMRRIASKAGVMACVVSEVLGSGNPDALAAWQQEAMLMYDTFEDALYKHSGNVADAAKELGLQRRALASAIASSPYLQSVQRDIKDAAIDEAEKQLAVAVRSGYRWAIRMTLLSDQAEQRGWKEVKQQVNFLVAPAAQQWQLTDSDLDLTIDQEEETDE